MFYLILEQNKCFFSRLNFPFFSLYLSNSDLIFTQLGNTVSTWRNYTHHSVVSLTADRNSTKRKREGSGIGNRGEISKTGRRRIKLPRIAPIRERVNLHSIKFVVIKSISAIQPAWPLHYTHTRAHRELFRAHIHTPRALPIGILINHACIIDAFAECCSNRMLSNFSAFSIYTPNKLKVYNLYNNRKNCKRLI